MHRQRRVIEDNVYPMIPSGANYDSMLIEAKVPLAVNRFYPTYRLVSLLVCRRILPRSDHNLQ